MSRNCPSYFASSNPLHKLEMMLPEHGTFPILVPIFYVVVCVSLLKHIGPSSSIILPSFAYFTELGARNIRTFCILLHYELTIGFLEPALFTFTFLHFYITVVFIGQGDGSCSSASFGST